jgi:adenylate cyclase
VAGKGALLTGRPKHANLIHFLTWYWREAGIAHFACGQYQDAIVAIKRSANLPYSAHAYLAACYSLLDQIAEARNSVTEVMRLLPAFVSSQFVAKQAFRRLADRPHLSEGLRKAGLPD